VLAGARELIELGAAVVVRYAPRGLDVALLLELEQRRIQRAVVHQQQLTAGLLDAPGDAVPMLRPHRLERLENHQRQRALPDVGFAHSQRSKESKRSKGSKQSRCL